MQARSATLLVVLGIATCSVEAANLEGRLLDGSTPDGTVRGHPVRLTAQLADQSRIDETIDTRVDGTYAFTGLPGDTADVYVVSTSFDGVDYVSNFIRFPAGTDRVEADLIVYHATRDDSLLRLNARHVIVEIAPGVDHVLVTEVLAFGNPGSETIVAERPVTLGVPQHASAVEAVEGFSDARILGDDLVLSLEGSVRPGTFRYEGALRYHLPARFPLAIAATTALPVDEVTVLVSPPGTHVHGEGLEPLGTIDLGGGVLCDRFRVPVEANAGSFSVSIEPALEAVERSPRAVLITGGLLAAFAGLLVLRDRASSGSGATGESAQLERDLSRVLNEIVSLDARGHDSAAEREREKLFVKATVLQELIDQLRERNA